MSAQDLDKRSTEDNEPRGDKSPLTKAITSYRTPKFRVDLLFASDYRRAMEIPRAKDWPRAPIHRLGSDGIYMITAATLHKTLLFNTPEKLSLLEDNLLTLSKKYRWHLEAWAVFANHYHFIARNEVGSDEMWRFLKHLHTDSSRFLNRLDNAAGRKVW